LKEDDGEGASQVELGITTCAERVHSCRGEKYSDRSTEIFKCSFKFFKSLSSSNVCEHLHARHENVPLRVKKTFFFSHMFKVRKRSVPFSMLGVK
jgi:hypothetical protein